MNDYQNAVEFLVGDQNSYGVDFDVSVEEWYEDHKDDYRSGVDLEPDQVITISSDEDPPIILRLKEAGFLFESPASSTLITTWNAETETSTPFEIGPEAMLERSISDLPGDDYETNQQEIVKNAAHEAGVSLDGAIFFTVQS